MFCRLSRGWNSSRWQTIERIARERPSYITSVRFDSRSTKRPNSSTGDGRIHEDIVQRETFTFETRRGRSITLRPEARPASSAR